MRHSVCLLIFGCAFAAAAQDSSQPQFTARELFYAAAEQAPAKSASTPAPAPAPKKAVTPKRAPVSPPAQTPPAPLVDSNTSKPPASQGVQSASTVNGATAIRASMTTAPAPATGTPLGLKYTILKKSGDDMVEVPPDTIFHSGDRIQLSVQTNGPGYLYIISQGSSGTWQPLFPSADLANGDNHVDGWNANVLPPKSRMVFDEQTGTEKIFIVFSRTPEQGLDKMIYSLKEGAKPQPAAEKAEEAQPTRKYLMTASAEIPDSAVGRLRTTYTRDLIIEKVDEKTPADKSPEQKKEAAVYVVNPSGSSDSRVVADVTLVHR